MTTKTKGRWKSGTLEEFVEHHGSQIAAAAVIGIHECSVNRYLNEKSNVQKSVQDRFKELRIQYGEAKDPWEGGTLKKFVKYHGSQREAAKALGIREEHLNRIINKHIGHFNGMTRRKFLRLKITVGR